MAHDQKNYPGLQGTALPRVLVDRCLKPADKDQAYLRLDTFLHDLMKPVNAVRDISDKNYRALEEYLDLLIRTFDIAKDATMLPIVLHQNNLLPMYEKWPYREQARQSTHSEIYNILEPPAE
jgi:hypothetical protein